MISAQLKVIGIDAKGSILVRAEDVEVAVDEMQTLNGELIAVLERVAANYQAAASAAEKEGYETNYAQDAVLVDSLLAIARGKA